MGKRSSQHRHGSILKPCTIEPLQLVAAIHERFLNLTGSYFRITGETLYPPAYLDTAMILWRQTYARFDKGDLRLSGDEFRALQEIAAWTHEENCKLRGQPITKIQWDETKIWET